MKKVNELKAGAILTYINLAIGMIIPLFYTPIMLRLMGKEEYGLYSLSSSVISYLSLLTFGMGGAVTRYVTKCRAENDAEGVKKTFGLFLLLYCGTASLVCIVGTAISLCSNRFFSNGLSAEEIDKLKVLLIIMSVSTAVSFIVSVFSAVVVSYEKYIFRKSIDIVSSIVNPILNLIILFLGYRSIGIAIIGLVIQVLYTGVYILYCTKILKVTPKFVKMPKSIVKEIFAFSAFIFLGSIVDLLYWSTDKVLIGAMIGSAAVAVYNVGGVFTTMLQNMSSAISNVFVPRITTMVVMKEKIGELSNLLIRIGRLQYYIVSLIISGFFVFGMQFIHYWSGDGYLDAYYISLITMIPISIPLIQNIAFNVILAQKKHQFRAIIYAIIAVINVISTYYVLPVWGIIGAAVCTAVAYVLGNGIIMNVYYLKVTGLDIILFWKNIIKLTIIPFILSCTGWYIINCKFIAKNLIELLVQIIIYTGVFFILSWKFVMNSYEKQLFMGLVCKVIKRKK